MMSGYEVKVFTSFEVFTDQPQRGNFKAELSIEAPGKIDAVDIAKQFVGRCRSLYVHEVGSGEDAASYMILPDGSLSVHGNMDWVKFVVSKLG